MGLGRDTIILTFSLWHSDKTIFWAVPPWIFATLLRALYHCLPYGSSRGVKSRACQGNLSRARLLANGFWSKVVCSTTDGITVTGDTSRKIRGTFHTQVVTDFVLVTLVWVSIESCFTTPSHYLNKWWFEMLKFHPSTMSQNMGRHTCK